MQTVFTDLTSSNEALQEQAAVLLSEAFRERNIPAWPTLDDARREIKECTDKKFICIGCVHNNELLGWAGLRPMYEKTWELHPMVVKPDHQHKGIGRLLIQELERTAKEHGIAGIVLGSDDENGETTLSGKDFEKIDLFQEIKKIKNIHHHPYEFFMKCGYTIVGIIPDSGGFGKPDIWLWKRVK